MRRLAFLLALSVVGLTACGGGKPTAQTAPPPLAQSEQIAGEGTGIVVLMPPSATATTSPIVERDISDGTSAPAAQNLSTGPSVQQPAQTAPTASLRGTYWRLSTLAGVAITRYPNQPEPHIVLQPDGKTAGADGCNRFFGTYSAGEGTVTFGQGGTSLMACPEGAAQAVVFMNALRSTTGYRISGETLELLAGDKVVATFAAQPMR